MWLVKMHLQLKVKGYQRLFIFSEKTVIYVFFITSAKTSNNYESF